MGKKSISIKEGNEGKFGAYARSVGMSVQEAARHILANKARYSAARVKQANFARNAAGWKKQEGGTVRSDDRWLMTDDSAAPIVDGVVPGSLLLQNRFIDHEVARLERSNLNKGVPGMRMPTWAEIIEPKAAGGAVGSQKKLGKGFANSFGRKLKQRQDGGEEKAVTGASKLGYTPFFRTEDERAQYLVRLKEEAQRALAKGDDKGYLAYNSYHPVPDGHDCINGVCGLDLRAGLQFSNPADGDRYLSNPRFTKNIQEGKEDYYQVNAPREGDHLQLIDENGLPFHSLKMYNVERDKEGKPTMYHAIHNGGDTEFADRAYTPEEIKETIRPSSGGNPSMIAWRPGKYLDAEKIARERKGKVPYPYNHGEAEVEKYFGDTYLPTRFSLKEDKGLTPESPLYYLSGKDVQDHTKNELLDLMNDKELDREMREKLRINDATLQNLKPILFGIAGVESDFGNISAGRDIKERLAAMVKSNPSVGNLQIRLGSVSDRAKKAFDISKEDDLKDSRKAYIAALDRLFEGKRVMDSMIDRGYHPDLADADPYARAAYYYNQPGRTMTSDEDWAKKNFVYSPFTIPNPVGKDWRFSTAMNPNQSDVAAAYEAFLQRNRLRGDKGSYMNQVLRSAYPLNMEVLDDEGFDTAQKLAPVEVVGRKKKMENGGWGMGNGELRGSSGNGGWGMGGYQEGGQAPRPFYWNDPKVDSVLNANRHLNFVDRYLYPKKHPVLARNDDGTESTKMKYDERNGYSTHSMMSADNLVFPTVVQSFDGRMKRLSPKDAYNYALETGEFLKFNSEAEAMKFAENGYKKGMQEWREGGEKGKESESERESGSEVRGLVSRDGYKMDSPDRFNKFNVIPSGRITMKGVPHPVMGIDNLGYRQLMMPGVEYRFPGQAVFEVPMKSESESESEREGEGRFQQGGMALVPPFMMETRMHEPRVVDTMLPQDSPVFQQKQALDTAMKNREVLSRTPAQQAAYAQQYFTRQLAEADRKDWHRQQELDRRAKTVEESDAVQNNYSFFSPERWSRRNLAIAAQATPERFRLFPDDVGGAGDLFDNYVNPLMWVGNIAKGLGEAPLEAQQTSSVAPYFKAVGTPLVAGAIGMNPASTITSPMKGLFTSKGLNGQAQNVWENLLKSNAVDIVKDKSLEAGRQLLTPDGRAVVLQRYGGEMKREKQSESEGRMQMGGAAYAHSEGSGRVAKPFDETEAQRNELLLDMQSPKYLERLRREFGREDVADELQARINNVQHTRVVYNDGMPYNEWGISVPKQYKGEVYAGPAGWKLEASVPNNFRGLVYQTGWKPNGPVADPYQRNVPGTVYLEDVFRPGKKAPTEVANTPRHEFTHMATDGGVRIPYATSKMISEITDIGTDPVLFQKDGIQSSYLTRDTEFDGRKKSIEKDLRRAGIYDARTQDFTEEMYDKMMNDPTIRNNTDFQELHKVLRGDDAEKKRHFIHMMKYMASRGNGVGSMVARYGGMIERERERERGRYQDGGVAYQAPEGYAPSTPEQRANWNQFLNYMESQGMAGSADLDARDKRLGMQYLNTYNKAYPKTQVPESFIPTAQYENYLIRRENRFPTMSNEQSQAAFSGLSPAYKQYPLSGVDNWLGRYTSKQFYPTFRSGKALHKADGTEQVDSYDFGVNFEDYVRSKADPNVAQKYLVKQPAPVPVRQWGGEKLSVDSWRLSGGRGQMTDNRWQMTGGNPRRVQVRQMGGGYGNGFAGQGNIDPFNSNPFFTPVYGLPAAPAVAPPSPSPSLNDTGLYPYGVINPFDMDPYELENRGMGIGNPGKVSSGIPMLGIADKYDKIQIGNPSFTFNNTAKTAAGTSTTSAKKNPPSKNSFSWPGGVGMASGVIGGMAFLNNALEANDRNRYKEQERIRNLGDNKGLLLPGNVEQRRGDYVVNDGYFRPQRYVPTQFGVAQMGGFFSEAQTDVPVMGQPVMPVVPAASFEPQAARYEPQAASSKHSPNAAAQDAFDYYISDRGLAPHVAAGIVGNLYQESGLRTDVEEKGNTGNGRGIAQWDVRDRWKGLHKWAEKNQRDPNDLYTQLDYILEEPGEGAKVLKALEKAHTPEEAARIFGKVYERPSEKHANWEVRVGIARRLYAGAEANMASNDYREGGAYEVNEEELQRILREGGEVEFL